MVRETYTKQDVIDIVRAYGEDYTNTPDEVIINSVDEYLDAMEIVSEMESWGDGDLIL